jgi:bacterioferritin (cytochrome b1)
MKTEKKNDTNEASETKTTARRDLLSSGPLAIASMMAGLFAVACKDDDETVPAPTPDGGIAPTPDGGAVADNDIAQLNALLRAEYNAITAYTAGAGLITNAVMTDQFYMLRSVIVDIAVSFQTQHRIHAAALVDSIASLSGTPVAEADVAAAFKPPAALVANPSIMNVLKFAASAERGAAVAYNQVLAGLEDAKFRYLASAIEGDESQHFIVLAALILGLAVPTLKLNSTTATQVVPKAFVRSVGTKEGQDGLELAPPNYFA